MDHGSAEEAGAATAPIWRASDELWAGIVLILAEHGPQRIDQRAAFDALIFRLRTVCQ